MPRYILTSLLAHNKVQLFLSNQPGFLRNRLETREEPRKPRGQRSNSRDSREIRSDFCESRASRATSIPVGEGLFSLINNSSVLINNY